MNDITVEDEIKIIHDIQDDKEMFAAQMISNLKKRIAELEGEVVRLTAVMNSFDRKMMSDEGIQRVKQYWHELIQANIPEGGADDR